MQTGVRNMITGWGSLNEEIEVVSPITFFADSGRNFRFIAALLAPKMRENQPNLIVCNLGG
jgi:hypothetical protein